MVRHPLWPSALKTFLSAPMKWMWLFITTEKERNSFQSAMLQHSSVSLVSLHPSTEQFIHASIYASIHQLSIHQSYIQPSIYLLIHLLIYSSIQWSIPHFIPMFINSNICLSSYWIHFQFFPLPLQTRSRLLSLSLKWMIKIKGTKRLSKTKPLPSLLLSMTPVPTWLTLTSTLTGILGTTVALWFQENSSSPTHTQRPALLNPMLSSRLPSQIRPVPLLQIHLH